jgi:adenosine deaminase
MSVAESPLPLVDLHRHLDGSLRPSTLAELASRAGKGVPVDLAFQPGMGLDAALARFAFTLSVLQEPETVARIASEMCEDARAEGVDALEIRFAPQLHRAAPLEKVVDAALEGAAGRAGIILCGLYGEPPELLSSLVEIAGPRRGVVGIDLAGGPTPGHAYRMVDYAPAYRRAEALGIGRTVHAAEGRPAEEIRTAILALGAQRIGHGTTLLDDPEIVALVIERGVTIEACPTSNVHTGVLPSVEAHPLSKWLDAGVRACVCADNTLLSATTAAEELRRVRAIPGMTEDKLRRAVTFGHEAAFRR